MSELLPLTSIELYHLADDSPQFPNVIACDLIVSGIVDFDIATIALREAARNHLLICARLKKRGWRKPCWILDADQADDLVWQELPSGSAESSAIGHFQLDDELSGQFFWRTENGLTRLSFRAHHAAMDGGGGIQFVTDWMLNYQRISSGSDKPRPRQVNQELLRRRNHLRMFNRAFISKLWVQPVAILGATKFMFRRVTPVVPAIPKSSVSAETTPISSRLLSASLNDPQLQELKRRARECSATVNDVVLQAVFLALHQLRKKHGWHENREWLRLIIPINIRDFADRRLPAANRASVVQLDRTDRDFADPGGMVWGINYELGNIRRWNLEKTTLLVAKWMSLVPGWIPRFATRPKCRATSAVTNLGAPLDRVKLKRDPAGRLITGNLVIEDVDLIVPVKERTPAGFALVRYGGRQKIDLHFDPGQMKPEIAGELLELTVQNLTASLCDDSPTGSEPNPD